MTPGPDIPALVQLACLLEASAAKPGNVSPGRHFSDIRYEHFLASAAAIGEAFAHVATRPIGGTIRAAIEATARWAPSNTNLGIVLLLAPLARAAAAGGELRASLTRVLADTTVDDAREVYAAIRIAEPGGLGRADDQDVFSEPTLPLVEVMRLAADRDAIAREYATGFETTFDLAVPALEAARASGLAWDAAVVETFLKVLAARPDTHIARRGGVELARTVSARAARVLSAGGVRTPAGRDAIETMDAALRAGSNTASPGATADLTAAAIFVALAGGAWDGSNR
jgi:triphosphoribosyl-dephospho-CoA synthase